MGGQSTLIFHSILILDQRDRKLMNEWSAWALENIIEFNFPEIYSLNIQFINQSMKNLLASGVQFSVEFLITILILGIF